jgi:predicted RND superfamily exporter protein
LWGAVVGVGIFGSVETEISALSFGCAAILIGLGIDFTIHVSAAALRARADGLVAADAVTRAIHETRARLTLGALTSMAAFLAFTASEQGFLQQMGLLTVIGLCTCLLGAFLVLPPLLIRIVEAARPGSDRHRQRNLGMVALASRVFASPRPFVLIAVSLTAAALTALVVKPLRFEDDLRNIHARSSPPLRAQERIAEVFGGSWEPILVLVEGDHEADVVASCHRLQASWGPLLDDDSLIAVSSIADLLPEEDEQRRRLDLLRDRDAWALRGDLERALFDNGFDPQQFTSTIDGFEEAASLRRPMVLDDLRAAGLSPLVDRFVRERGGRAHALMVLTPTQELWTAEIRSTLLARLRELIEASGVNASLTGLHLISTESAQGVGQDFRRVSLLTLAAIVLVLVVRFRSPGTVLLILVPATLGSLWTGGLFALLGLRLNLMNLGVLPMILAIGIDDGIHIVSHFLDRGRDVLAAFRETACGVMFTSLTTMVTFGSLSLSRNQGLASVGVVTFCGIGACLLASVMVLPFLLRSFASRSDPKSTTEKEHAAG